MSPQRTDPSKPKKDESIEERSGLRAIFHLITLWGLVYGELDERMSVREAFEKALHKPVPPHANQMLCLGGISFLLFIIQAVTGTLLLFYYRPSIGEAFSSTQFINNHVHLGWMVRSAHSWGSTLMIAFVFLHFLNVFVRRAYRHPRDFTWVSGVFLMLLTMGFGFTGYLLPWTQLSYWATTVGTETAAAVPWLGDYLKIFMRGGPDVSAATLTRFFAIHVLILPFAITFFLFMHFVMIRRLGMADPL